MYDGNCNCYWKSTLKCLALLTLKPSLIYFTKVVFKKATHPPWQARETWEDTMKQEKYCWHGFRSVVHSLNNHFFLFCTNEVIMLEISTKGFLINSFWNFKESPSVLRCIRWGVIIAHEINLQYPTPPTIVFGPAFSGKRELFLFFVFSVKWMHDTFIYFVIYLVRVYL